MFDKSTEKLMKEPYAYLACGVNGLHFLGENKSGKYLLYSNLKNAILGIVEGYGKGVLVDTIEVSDPMVERSIYNKYDKYVPVPLNNRLHGGINKTHLIKDVLETMSLNHLSVYYIVELEGYVVIETKDLN